MRVRIVLLLLIFTLLLSGCSIAKTDDTIPVYFEPIVQELTDFPDLYSDRGFFYMDKWWDNGVQTGTYNDRIYTSYIDGVTHDFDLGDVLDESETWNWQTAGAFQAEGDSRTYIALVDFNLVLESGTEPSPQMLLLDFNTDKPQDYNITPFTVTPPKAFCWVEQCFRIDDKIYISSKNNKLGVIDLTTKQFYDCQEEFESMKQYTQKTFGEEYYPCFIRAVLEEGDVTVYSVEISGADDMAPVGAVFAAFRNHQAIDYMCYDFENGFHKR